ncbi:hypothetical protein D5086_031863 [Populus alba]|uniref:Uncharacterized protein n=1 Tax=Populus alba TaxID=43335 RepID=A0ACC4AKN9_POPAL
MKGKAPSGSHKHASTDYLAVEAWLGNSGGKPSTSPNVVHVFDDPLHIVVTYVEPLRRQYLTRSRVAASTSFGQQGRPDGVGLSFSVGAILVCFFLALLLSVAGHLCWCIACLLPQLLLCAAVLVESLICSLACCLAGVSSWHFVFSVLLAISCVGALLACLLSCYYGCVVVLVEVGYGVRFAGMVEGPIGTALVVVVCWSWL